MRKDIFTFNTRTVVTISIGAALYGIIGLVGIPIGPNVQLRPSIIVLSIFAVYFGPLVGFLAGFLGNMLTDLLAGWGIWWNWELASGIFGFFCGLVYLFCSFNIKYGICNKFHILFLIISSIIGFMLAYLNAGVIDILLMGEPPRKIFFQISVIFVTNVLVFLFLAMPIILSFIATNRKNSNLKIED